MLLLLFLSLLYCSMILSKKVEYLLIFKKILEFFLISYFKNSTELESISIPTVWTHQINEWVTQMNTSQKLAWYVTGW